MNGGLNRSSERIFRSFVGAKRKSRLAGPRALQKSDLPRSGANRV